MTISVFEIVLKKLFQTDGQLAAWTVEVEIVLLSPAVLVLGLSLATMTILVFRLNFNQQQHLCQSLKDGNRLVGTCQY